MLSSNPPTPNPTNPHQEQAVATTTAAQRRRQQQHHRRQNSTPSAFETVRMQKNLTSNVRPSAGGHHHRRGLSLDTRRIAAKTAATTRQQHNQDFSPVSIPTNQGLAKTQQPQHHVLREAQQQRIQARPGPQYVHNNNSNHSQQQQFQQQQQPQQNDPESYLMSPHGLQTPNSCFDAASMSFDHFLSMQQQKNQPAYGNNMAGDFFTPNSALSTPNLVDFHESPSSVGQGWISEGETASTRRTSRRISNGIMDRVSKFENMGVEGSQRPVTPPNQNANSYFPPTPMETPHSNHVKMEPPERPDRFCEGYDESMEETLKPTKKATQQRTQGIFEDMRRQAEAAVPTPPRSNTMPQFKTYDAMALPTSDFMDMNNFNNEFMKMQGDFGGLDSTDSNDLSSQQAVGPCPFGTLPDLRHTENSSSPTRSHDSRRGSPHRRTDSLASIASAASIASINIEETKTDTGVTIEEISTFIQGPDPTDNKWLCLYEGCGKKFGRKENIKSHVQTHLNDRQYQCPTCKKCFVRQHDLKRHAKIHTGIKPYPCECGNSFARHDALTRHRQRGMCIGAFDGIVRKVVKRGRPRKNRPDMGSRVEKSTRTRRKNNMSVSSISSQSGCSDSSAANSPQQHDFDMLDNNDFDLMDVAMDNDTITGSVALLPVSSATHSMPILTSEAPNLQEYANSPESMHGSQHSYVSPEAIMEAPSHLPPKSPAKSVASQFNEPPELSQSCSPPASRLFDAEGGVSSNTSPKDSDVNNLSALIAATTAGSQNLSRTLTVGISGQDDEMLLKSLSTGDDRLLQLDRDPGMFMMTKFDEEYGVSMLENDNDMFFGTN